MSLKVFVDSDVVISSLLSSSGAAHLLLNNTEQLELIISTLSLKEIEAVSVRLEIEKSKLEYLVDKKFSVIALNDEDLNELKQYQDFVLDPNDAHIVMGAKSSKANFLITYNTKHFKIDYINENLGFTVLTPAMLLQYLRSR